MATMVDNCDSNSLHILVVEDSSSARLAIVSSLKGIDAEIHEANDGLPAYNLLRQDPARIDLVLSDLVMKKMHGDELCAKIRNELGIKDLPIIILSSKTEKETILKLFRSGANDYLFKPFTPEELVARIRAHLDQRLLNKVLKTTIAELRESNRMKDHFLAVCSHDFRSPLQGIIGYTDLLLNDDALNARHKKILQNIMKSGSQLHGLIESLLDFPLAGKKPENIPMRPVNLADVIRSCVTSCSFSAVNKDIQLLFSPPADLPMLTGNAHALSRVFSNLLSNAIKFTPAGGTVAVDIRPDDGRNLSISVQDNGIGIAEEVIPTIFDFYSKASRKGTQGEKSTGLGLFISRQLVDLHKGKIHVASRIDKGSCFTVILPLAPSP